MIENIYQNVEREYYVKVLVKRLHRIERNMSGKAREDFAAFIPEGDIGKFANKLTGMLKNDFSGTMALLRDKKFQHLLLNYERPKREFLIGYEVEDAVTSEVMIRAGSHYQKPEDYLDSFARFVRENPDHIEAIQILLQKPREWKAEILSELRKKLAQHDFPEKKLQRAHKLVLNKALADIISMIKHAATEQEPIYTAEGRVDRALKKVMIGKSFNEEQLEWLEFIRQHLIANLSIAMEDFDYAPVFERHGGKGKANKVFGGGLEFLVAEINYAIAA